MRDEGLFMSLVIHYWIGHIQDSQGVSASEFTNILSGGEQLNTTYWHYITTVHIFLIGRNINTLLSCILTVAHCGHTRGNVASLHTPACNSVAIAGFSWHHFTNMWNSLLNKVVTAVSINCFGWPEQLGGIGQFTSEYCNLCSIALLFQTWSVT